MSYYIHAGKFFLENITEEELYKKKEICQRFLNAVYLIK